MKYEDDELEAAYRVAQDELRADPGNEQKRQVAKRLAQQVVERRQTERQERERGILREALRTAIPYGWRQRFRNSEVGYRLHADRWMP